MWNTSSNNPNNFSGGCPTCGSNQMGQTGSSGQQWNTPQQWTGTYWQGNQGFTQPGFGQWSPGWQGGYGFNPSWPGWQGSFGFNPSWSGWQGGMGPGFNNWQGWGGNMGGAGFSPNWQGGGDFAPSTAGYGLGGLRRWGGTYSPQYTSTGLPTDEEVEEMIYDALDDDPMIPWDADIEVKVDAGEVTLSGTVPNKRIKHAAGDDAWWISGVTDVHNEIKVQGRHKGRTDEQQQPAGRRTRQTTGTTSR